MDKKDVELAVCKKFVELCNNKFPHIKLEVPKRGQDPPDCTSKSQTTKKVYGLEVMAASPEEKENLGKTYFHEILCDSTNITPKVEQICKDIKEKKEKYEPTTKLNIILLLEKSAIEYDDEEMAQIENFLKKNEKWQNNFREIGFREIWYVSTEKIFRLF